MSDLIKDYTVTVDNREVYAHDCPACFGERVLAPADECAFCRGELNG